MTTVTAAPLADLDRMSPRSISNPTCIVVSGERSGFDRRKATIHIAICSPSLP